MNTLSTSYRIIPFLAVIGTLASITWTLSPVLAQEAAAEARLNPLPDAVAEQLHESWQAIGQRRDHISDLERRIKGSEGAMAEVLERRLDKSMIGLLEDVTNFGVAVADQSDAGFDVSRYQDNAIRALQSQTDLAAAAAGHVRKSMDIPSFDLPAAEQALVDRKLFEARSKLDDVYETFMVSIDASRRFDLDITNDEDLLVKSLADRLVNNSVFLELMVNEVTGLRAGVAALPGDAEMMARLKIAEDRVSSTAKALSRVISMGEAFGLDTFEYREQLLTATGELTTDIFDLQVVGKLLSRWGQVVADRMTRDGPTFLFRVILFVGIIYISRKVAKVAEQLMQRALATTKFQLSQLLRRMIVLVGRNLILILGILIALAQVGISLGPLLAGLGIVGFIVGFALQDSLANFAAGMMILVYRPFDVGDLIETGGVFGKVSQMSLVNTTILTIDNQTIIMPNNMIWGGVIKNVAAQNIRRVDLMFGISYSDDIAKAEQVLGEIVASHEKVLADPEPTIRLHELGDSSVNFVVRPWVNTDDYWDVYWDIMRTVKLRFDAEGLSIPFPQRDVHLYKQEAI